MQSSAASTPKRDPRRLAEPAPYTNFRPTDIVADGLSITSHASLLGLLAKSGSLYHVLGLYAGLDSGNTDSYEREFNNHLGSRYEPGGPDGTFWLFDAAPPMRRLGRSLVQRGMPGAHCVVHGGNRVLVRISDVVEQYHPLIANYNRIFDVFQANEQVRPFLHSLTRKQLSIFLPVRFGSLVMCCERLLEFQDHFLPALNAYAASAGGLSQEQQVVKSIIENGDVFHYARAYVYLTETSLYALKLYDTGVPLGGFVIASVLLTRDDLERRLAAGRFPVAFAQEVVRVIDSVWRLRLTGLDTIAAKGSLHSVLLLQMRKKEVDWLSLPDPQVQLRALVMCLERSSALPPGVTVDELVDGVPRDWAKLESRHFSKADIAIILAAAPANVLQQLVETNVPYLCAVNPPVQMHLTCSSSLERYFSIVARIRRLCPDLTPEQAGELAAKMLREKVGGEQDPDVQQHRVRETERDMLNFSMELLPGGRPTPLLPPASMEKHVFMFATKLKPSTLAADDVTAAADPVKSWEDVEALEKAMKEDGFTRVGEIGGYDMFGLPTNDEAWGAILDVAVGRAQARLHSPH